MSYLALYREWRPKTFMEMVGQEHVCLTLINALKYNKVAHAYLFSGPRGTGKTTAAKILAKALNCLDREEFEPCNKCSSCQSIDRGVALDVLEIDAASNRGIDEIRDLREKVKFSSAEGQYKVYIIDEVHMLTNDAFNALLKTLEDPPKNVVFVLATTEAHKIPLTILSRVQRFEFHRISTADIAARLKQICEFLGREIEDKAIQVIALKAEGGLRDALSILDQCLVQDGVIREEHVFQIIGMVGEVFSADLTDCLLEQDYAKTLNKLEQGVALGRDPRQIIAELLDYLRQCLLYAAGKQEPFLSPELVPRLIHQSEKAGLGKLLQWIEILLKGESELRFVSNARLAAEMILIQVLYQKGDSQSSAANMKVPESPESVNYPAGKPSDRKDLSVRPPVDTDKEKPQVVSQHEPNNNNNFSQNRSLAGMEFQTEDFIEMIKTKWPQVMEEVKKINVPTHAFLLEGTPAALKSGCFYVVFKEKFSFHRDKLAEPDNTKILEQALEKVLAVKLKVVPLMESDYQALMEQESSDERELGADSSADSCVKKALDIFGPELVQVRKDK